MTAEKTVFSGTDLSCRRAGRVVFQKVNFRVESGEVLHIVGPNGAGKSSLLRLMAGLSAAETGEVLWQSFGPKACAFLPPDDRALKPLETVLDTLTFWADVQAAPRARIAQALTAMDLEALKDTPVRRLSAGQKRRLSLARLFLTQATLWLLDEPLNALDTAGIALLTKALAAHAAAGGLAVVASHAPLPAISGMRLATLTMEPSP